MKKIEEAEARKWRTKNHAENKRIGTHRGGNKEKKITEQERK